MKVTAVVALIALAGGCAAPPAGTLPHVAVPEVPASMVPTNGSVIERWPGGTVRSERTYRGGKVQTAVYYASDGSVVYEMSEEGELVSQLRR